MSTRNLGHPGRIPAGRTGIELYISLLTFNNMIHMTDLARFTLDVLFVATGIQIHITCVDTIFKAWSNYQMR